MKKRILAGFVGLLFATQASAQVQLGAGQVYGNNTAARAPAQGSTVTSILDRALGSTRGAILERGASGWQIVAPSATVGLPWVSAGAGADPLYQALTVAGGGTGLTTLATGDLLQASSTSALARLAAVATGNVLLSGGVGTISSWGKVTSSHLNITATTCTNQFLTAISATGTATCTTDTLASAQHANQGTATQVLHGNAAGNPSWSAVSLTADVTGNLPVANLNGGTGASGSTFWRGDATWGAAVTSVGITPSTSLSVSGSPVTGSGNITVTYRPPTIQSFTGSVSGTYTTPANVSLIKVTLCGATGGGAGSGTGTTGVAGGTPSASTFSGGTLSCAGGNGGTASLAGTGTTCTGTGYILPGKDGQAVSTGVAGNFIAGSLGGPSPIFGNVGGRGGFFNGAGNTGGGGGGAGCIINYISSPAATYSYSLSAGGSAGTAGTSGSAGAAGEAARLTVEEF